MTLKELSGLYYICKSILREEERLQRLRDKAENVSPKLSDMPRAHGGSSRVEDLVLQICESEEKIKVSLDILRAEEQRISSYIGSIDDIQTRLIMQYRFVDLLTWDSVAARICQKGFYVSANSVRMRCYRYIKENH